MHPASVQRFLSLTVAKVPLREVDIAIQTVFSRIRAGQFVRSSSNLNLSRIYKLELPAGGAHLFKLAVYSPEVRPDSTALVTNLADGWNSLSYLIAKEHKSYQIQIISTSATAEYLQNRIEIWDGGVTTRVVMAMRDSNEWVFFQKGCPADFEDLDLYKTKIKRKRLSREIILGYMREAGFDLAAESFWRAEGDAVYYEQMPKADFEALIVTDAARKNPRRSGSTPATR